MNSGGGPEKAAGDLCAGIGGSSGYVQRNPESFILVRTRIVRLALGRDMNAFGDLTVLLATVPGN
jgi:hypothetical protein